jgi:signal transduction histidine kinase
LSHTKRHDGQIGPDLERLKQLHLSDPEKERALGELSSAVSGKLAELAETIGRRGDIRVRIGRDRADQATLIVEDDGVGWADGGGVRGSGLGTKIIKAMASNLKSTVQIDSSGSGTRISLPFAL